MSEAKRTAQPWIVRVQRGCYEGVHTFNGDHACVMANEHYRTESHAIEKLAGPWCVTIETRGAVEASYSTKSEVDRRVRHPTDPPNPWLEFVSLLGRATARAEAAEAELACLKRGAATWPEPGICGMVDCTHCGFPGR